MVCGVLGAALIAAQKDKCIVTQGEREANESLQELVRKLQAELEMEQVKRQLAGKVLADEKRLTENLKPVRCFCEGKRAEVAAPWGP